MVSFFSTVKRLDLCCFFSVLAAIAAPISTAATNVFCVLILLVWLCSGRVLETLKYSWDNPLGKCIAVFYLWLIIGAFYADSDWVTRSIALSSWKKLIIAFILLGVFATSAVWQKRFVFVFVGIMLITALASTLFWLTDYVVLPGSKRGIPGILMTTYLAQSIAFTVALISCLVIWFKSPHAKWRLLWWPCILLFTFNIFFISPARSGYIAALAALLFVITYFRGLRKLPYIIALLGILAAFFLSTSSTIQMRIEKTISDVESYQAHQAETSVGARLFFYKNTLALIPENPVFGVGTSGFKNAFVSHLPQNHKQWMETSDPHNQYLFIWVENGLIGLLLFLLLIYVGFKQSYIVKSYGVIAGGLLAALCISSLFSSHFKTFPEGYMLAFFLGALLANPSRIMDESRV